MNDYLDLPPDLLHLIEKREQEERRKAERRCEESGAPSPADHDPDIPGAPALERRTGADRRSGEDRRSE